MSDYTAWGSVAKCEKAFSFSRSAVPGTETSTFLVREQNIVLVLVETGELRVFLLTGRTSTCVGNETSVGGEFPEFTGGVHARCENVLGIKSK